MASSLPELTFTQGSKYTTVGTDGVEIFDEIKNAFDNAANWRVKSSTRGTSGSAASRLVVAPKAGSAIADFEALIIITETSSDLNSASKMLNHAINATDYTYIGVAPDGGITEANFNTANPTGSGRWAGMVNVSNNSVNAVYLVESDETCMLVMCDTTTSAYSATYFGAILSALDDADTDESDNRIYGQATSGGDGISTTMNTNTSGAGFLFGCAASTNYAHAQMGVFNPQSTSNLIACKKIVASLNDDNAGLGHMTTSTSRRLHMDIAIRSLSLTNGQSTSTDIRLLGIVRQVRFGEESKARQVLLNSDSTTQGYVISRNETSDNDVVVVSNNR